MSKKSIIDSIEVKKPCTESWGEMTGSEQVRFCSHCAQSVNNISEMTRKDAIHLVRSSGGNLCIRYIPDPRTQAPTFSHNFVNISRRAPRIAAGVMSASLSLATLAYGQTPTQPEVITGEQINAPVPMNLLKERFPINGEGSRLTGEVHDANGAVIPGAYITLINENNSAKRTAVTSDEGIYVFENLEAGSYTLRSDGSRGFAPTEKTGIQISDGDVAKEDIEMGAMRYAIMGDISIAVQYKGQLARAVAEANVEDVRNLIARGEDVNGREDDRITPLFLAVENGNIEITEMLLNFGAKVNPRNNVKESPLMKLDEDASKELVELLIRHGAKVNLKDASGNTALILAAQNAKPEILQALIDAGADVNEHNDEGQTALLNAAYSDDLEAVRVLLLGGAEVNAKNSEGETAYDKASDKEVEQLLVSFGAVVKDKAETPEEPEDPNPDNT